MHRRTIAAAALLTLALAGCRPAMGRYEGTDFVMPLPVGWTVMQPPIQGFPAARAAFLRADASGGNVVLTVLRSELSTQDAANFVAAIDLATRQLPDYAEESRTEIDFGGVRVPLVTYAAEDPSTRQAARFRQIAIAAEGHGYLLKAHLPPTLDDGTDGELLAMMRGFQVRVPE